MEQKSRVCGDYPSQLIRCFDEEQYALEFFEKGVFRVKLNTSYTSIECAHRRDKDEGSGTYKMYGEKITGLVHPDPNFPIEWFSEYGEVSHHTSSTNAVYILCCSASDNLEMVKQKFGKYAVRIHDPHKLAKMIDEYLNSGPNKFLVFGSMVQYNRGKLLSNISDDEKPKLADLSYIQKDQSFSIEEEFRYCLISLQHASDDSDEPLYLDLGQPLNYIEPLWLN